MIVDIRGTHGSGKTWIADTLMERYGMEPLYDLSFHATKPIGHELPGLNAAIVGRYDVRPGGCDGIKEGAEEVCRRVRLLVPKYRHVILEGILVAHTFKRYNELAIELEHAGHEYRFFFLDTPLQKCIDRVLARRKAKGNHKPFDPKNVINDWHNIWQNVRAKMHEAGRHITILNHTNPLPVLLWHLGRLCK